jgi:hypothetical protein
MIYANITAIIWLEYERDNDMCQLTQIMELRFHRNLHVTTDNAASK